jgi:hypothetical protein
VKQDGGLLPLGRNYLLLLYGSRILVGLTCGHGIALGLAFLQPSDSLQLQTKHAKALHDKAEWLCLLMNENKKALVKTQK